MDASTLIRFMADSFQMTWTKVDILYSVTLLERTPIFEWYVVECGFKNGHTKRQCV